MPKTSAELWAFMRQRDRQIGDLTRSRATQTNEVGRCAVLLRALAPTR